MVTCLYQCYVSVNSLQAKKMLSSSSQNHRSGTEPGPWIQIQEQWPKLCHRTGPWEPSHRHRRVRPWPCELWALSPATSSTIAARSFFPLTPRPEKRPHKCSCLPSPALHSKSVTEASDWWILRHVPICSSPGNTEKQGFGTSNFYCRTRAISLNFLK